MVALLLRTGEVDPTGGMEDFLVARALPGLCAVWREGRGRDLDGFIICRTNCDVHANEEERKVGRREACCEASQNTGQECSQVAAPAVPDRHTDEQRHTSRRIGMFD